MNLYRIHRAMLLLLLTTPTGGIAADVLKHHLNDTRDGNYIDPALTQTAVQTTHWDSSFYAPVPGPIYAQPVYVSNGPAGQAAFIVVTEQDEVVALDATTGSPIWTSTLGNPVPLSTQLCGNIDPLGITGTPVIDPDARALYLDALTISDDGISQRHLIFALSLDDGSTLAGWPLDVSAVITYSGMPFDSSVQNQRGALLLSAGILYVPYGGRTDCGNYNGWVVAVPVNNPGAATAWANPVRGGGVWAPGGLATDGSSIFATTGNAFGETTWTGGEAVIRFGPGATFSGNPADYFTPSNWQALDAVDLDLGGSGPVLVDVPGASPSQLVIALGKNGVAYLLDRNNLGGVGTGDGTTGEGLFSLQAADDEIINAAAAYTAPSGTYVVFQTFGSGVGCPNGAGNLVALNITASTPPTLSVAWCASYGGYGSPIVTTTDGTSQPVVWIVGAGDGGDSRLHAFDGETGQVLFAGGGPTDQMGLVRGYQTPIAVNGRIIVAGDDGLYAFTTGSPSAQAPSIRRPALQNLKIVKR